jgi:LmbE family N-acetylglucosaminyl deacetylase
MQQSKKVLFAIFAHPDDEAAGPCATLLQRVEQGEELHLVCATNGSSGMNPDNVTDIGEVRQKEWLAAGKAIGASGMHMLQYPDGQLCNDMYHAIAEEIEKLIRAICDGSSATELRFMTFDTNGLTGHLDHIAMSHITTYLFYKLRQSPPPKTTVKELAYYCFSTQQMPKASLDYFVLMPAGYADDQIDRRVDVRHLFTKKKKIIGLHHSQRNDDMLLSFGEEFHAVDSFRVIT